MHLFTTQQKKKKHSKWELGNFPLKYTKWSDNVELFCNFNKEKNKIVSTQLYKFGDCFTLTSNDQILIKIAQPSPPTPWRTRKTFGIGKESHLDVTHEEESSFAHEEESSCATYGDKVKFCVCRRWIHSPANTSAVMRCSLFVILKCGKEKKKIIHWMRPQKLYCSLR